MNWRDDFDRVLHDIDNKVPLEDIAKAAEDVLKLGEDEDAAHRVIDAMQIADDGEEESPESKAMWTYLHELFKDWDVGDYEINEARLASIISASRVLRSLFNEQGGGEVGEHNLMFGDLHDISCTLPSLTLKQKDLKRLANVFRSGGTISVGSAYNETDVNVAICLPWYYQDSYANEKITKGDDFNGQL